MPRRGWKRRKREDNFEINDLRNEESTRKNIPLAGITPTNEVCECNAIQYQHELHLGPHWFEPEGQSTLLSQWTGSPSMTIFSLLQKPSSTYKLLLQLGEHKVAVREPDL